MDQSHLVLRLNLEDHPQYYLWTLEEAHGIVALERTCQSGNSLTERQSDVTFQTNYIGLLGFNILQNHQQASFARFLL